MRLFGFWILILMDLVSYADACKKKQTHIHPKIRPSSTNSLLEGDIAVPVTSGTVSNAFLTKTDNLWDKGIVYYTFEILDGEPYCSDADIEIIEAALKHITDNVPCLKFSYRPFNSTDPKLIFTNMGDDHNSMDGCWSYVGFQRNPKGQVINLGPDECYTIGSVVHEVLHGLGATHEQSRPDRNNHIKILWENVIGGKGNTDFKMKSDSKFSSYATDYDFESVMHYPMNLNSRDGGPTMKAKDSTKHIDIRPTSEMSGMSTTDIFELGRVYTDKTENSCFKKENVLEYMKPKKCPYSKWYGTGCREYKYSDGDVYNGEWKNSKCHGKGTYTWTIGEVYTGEWNNNVRTGFGVNEFANGNVYIGEWANDTIQGKGTFNWTSGEVYTGEWNNGDRSGFGVNEYASGNVYIGEWANDIRHGKGTFTWTNGNVYTGDWNNDDRTGFGVQKFADGTVYKGEWVNNTKHGNGTFTGKDGDVYSGEWHNDIL